nr:MAG TPA: hypothetical protein [Bacteriophage sp.]
MVNKINSHEEAREWLLNKITPTERHNRIGQAVALGLAGGALGAGAGYLAKKRAGTGMLIGGALGAIGGYAMKPRMTTEDNRRIAQGTLAGFKTFHVIATLPSGQVFHETYKTAEDAKAIAGKLKQNGNKAYVVSSDEYGAKQENRQFGFLKHIRGGSSKADYKRGLTNFGNTNENFFKGEHHIGLSKEAKEAFQKDAIAAGESKVIGEKQFLGNTLGSLGGALTGGGLGYLAGKKIAGLKSEEAYIKEYLSKHPGAKKADAQKAYQERLKRFQSIGANVGALGGGYLGSRVGGNLGRKVGQKHAEKLTKELVTTGNIK